jgi:hypothetical protein
MSHFLRVSPVLRIISRLRKSPRSILDDLQNDFISKYPAFIVPLGPAHLRVKQWEEAIELCADTENLAVQFLDLAKAHPKTAIAEEALWWIIAYCPKAPTCGEAVEVYTRDFSVRFADTWRALVESAPPYADCYFRTIAEKSADPEISGLAMLARAGFRERVMHDSATAENLLLQAGARYGDVVVSHSSGLTLRELAKAGLVSLKDSGPIFGAPLRLRIDVPRIW